MEYSMQSLTEPTLLIDGDLYLYKAAAACLDETEWAEDQWTTTTNLVAAKDIVSKNFIKWQLMPGEFNSLEYSFWNWNELLLGLLLILLLILIAYFVRFYRYKIGSSFPELPSK